MAGREHRLAPRHYLCLRAASIRLAVAWKEKSTGECLETVYSKRVPEESKVEEVTTATQSIPARWMN